jgi:hypothetical protein
MHDLIVYRAASCSELHRVWRRNDLHSEHLVDSNDYSGHSAAYVRAEELVMGLRSFGAWLGIKKDPVAPQPPSLRASVILAWRWCIVLIPVYTLANGAFLAWQGLPDDVYSLWYLGSWTAAFTIIMIRCSPAKIGWARYFGAIGVGFGVIWVGADATGALLRHDVVLWPRLAIAVIIGTVAVTVAITFAHFVAPRRPATGRDAEPSAFS